MTFRTRAFAALLAVATTTAITAVAPGVADAAALTRATSVTVDLPVPAGADASGVYVDGAPVCVAARACVLAGSYAVGDNVYRPLLEVTTGKSDGSWRAVTLPLPAGAASAYLSDVQCPGTRECYAIGNYLPTGDDTGAGVGFAVTLSSGTVSNGTWSLVTLPGSFTLRALSCPASHQCVAVGTAPGGAGVGVLTFDGTAVRADTVAAPPGTSPANVTQVNCAAGPFCSTGTAAFDGPHGNYVLIDDRGRFSYSLLPNTTDAAGTQYLNNGPQTVSCPVVGFCVYADIAYFDSGPRNSAIKLLYSVYDRGSVSTAVAPLPAGVVGAAGNTRSSSPVWGVTCASRTNCTGVGSSEYYDPSGRFHQIAFVDTFRGGALGSARVTSNDVVNTNANGNQGPVVQPITESCPAAGQCGFGVNLAVDPGPTGAVSLRADRAAPVTVPVAAPAGLAAGKTVVVDALTCRPGLAFCAGVGRAGSLSDGFGRTVLTTVTAS